MQKRIYISIPLLLLTIGAFAQTANPFDLKWRNKGSEPSALESVAKDTHLVSLPETVARNDKAGSYLDEVTLIDSGIVMAAGDASNDSVTEEPVNVVVGANEITRGDPLTTHPELDDAAMVDSAVLGPESKEPATNDPKSSVLTESSSDFADKSTDRNNMLPSLPADDTHEALVKREPSSSGSIGLALFLILFGLSLVILTWAVNINRGFIQKIYKAALNENFSALLLREQRFASSQFLYYIVYAVFFLNGGLFIYLVSRYAIWDFGHRNTPMILFLVFLVVMYVVKHIVTRLLGETFQISNEMRHFNFNIILYNILAGIALMPVNLFLAFGPPGMRMPMIYAGLGIIVFMYIMRQFRGFIIGSHLIMKYAFQFFVYLCAIEILPVLVLIKFFPN